MVVHNMNTNKIHDGLFSPVVVVLGIGQMILWGITYYLPAIIIEPISVTTAWRPTEIISAFSASLFISAIVSPTIGKLITIYSGKLIILLGLAINSAGLLLMSMAQNIAVYWLAWGLLGIGMASSLYSSAFSILTAIFGSRARVSITNITLYGGFASTVFWPLGNYLLSLMDWRDLLLVYACFSLILLGPAYWFCIPATVTSGERRKETSNNFSFGKIACGTRNSILKSSTFIRLASIFTIFSFINTTIAIYLIVILENFGLENVISVGLATLIGPSQVVSRIFDRLILRKLNPLWTLTISCFLIVSGLYLILQDTSLIFVGLILYGAGNGLISIAKGTAPLVLFGKNDYSIISGYLQAPILIFQSLAPILVSFLFGFNANGTLVLLLFVLSLLTLPLSISLLIRNKI